MIDSWLSPCLCLVRGLPWPSWRKDGYRGGLRWMEALGGFFSGVWRNSLLRISREARRDCEVTTPCYELWQEGGSSSSFRPPTEVRAGRLTSREETTLFDSLCKALCKEWCRALQNTIYTKFAFCSSLQNQRIFETSKHLNNMKHSTSQTSISVTGLSSPAAACVVGAVCWLVDGTPWALRRSAVESLAMNLSP